MATLPSFPRPVERLLVDTGTYIVPAGRVARVVANVSKGGTFSIDGTQFLNNVRQFINLTKTSATGDLSLGYTVPVGMTLYDAYGSCAQSANPDIVLHSLFVGAKEVAYVFVGASMQRLNGTFPQALDSGENISVRTTANGNILYLRGLLRNHGREQQDFTLQEGQSFTGTGHWNAIVELYYS